MRASVTAMWVDPRFRRQGVGDLLLKTVVDWARGDGYRQVFLWVTDGNDNASGTSVARVRGAIERGEEAVMIVKTRASLAAEVSAAVKHLHTYDTPAILVLPLESVEKTYLGWLFAETGTEKPAET